MAQKWMKLKVVSMLEAKFVRMEVLTGTAMIAAVSTCGLTSRTKVS
jgi:hypothetical protein